MTQEEILRPRFGPAGRGVYKISDVENHLYSVSEYCSELVRTLEVAEKEKRDLNEKIGILTKQLEEYKEEEDNIKLVLLNAQRMAAKMKKESDAQCEEIIEEGKKQRDIIVESARKKALAEINEMKSKNEAYITDAVTKADEYFARAKNEYETKTTEAEARANEVLHDAAKKAEYIISESRIRAAAAVEKANAAIAHIKEDNSEIMLAMQREMATIRNLVQNYKEEISSVLTRNMELIEGIEEPENVAAIFDQSVFEPISSDINEEIPESYKEKKEIAAPAESVKNTADYSKGSFISFDTQNIPESVRYETENSGEVSMSKMFTFDGTHNIPADEGDDDPFASILATVAAENQQADIAEKTAKYVEAQPIFEQKTEQPAEMRLANERTKVFDPLKVDDPDSLEFGSEFSIFDENEEYEYEDTESSTEDEETSEHSFFPIHRKKK